MTQRILFTLAILAGLAAAPSARAPQWHGSDHIAAQVHHAVARTLSHVGVLHAGGPSHEMRAHGSHDGEAQGAQAGRGDEPCDAARQDGGGHIQHCEVREQTLPAGPLTVDAAPNGGITVEAWDRGDILVRAIVRSNARDDARAKAVAAQIQVQAAGGRVSATGPERQDGAWWSVSYRISVPRRNDLDLTSHNGGITITGVTGRVAFETSNGGVRLMDVGGDVHGRTDNGGVSVALGGPRWDGAGLDVETTNGSVNLSIPEGYSAQLETRTHNGGVRSDYPLTLQGDLDTRRGFSTTLGSGGAPVRVRTVNGGLRIARR